MIGASVVLAVLVASLVGSPHCAGMCGGLVCFYAGSGAGARGARRGHAAYHLTRLAGYLGLGGVAGALGAALDTAGRSAGLARVAAVASGALMVAWGLSRIALLQGIHLALPPLSGFGTRLQVLMASRLRAMRDRSATARAATLGALTTLLPCGWLYAFVVTAGGTGSAVAGMLVMLAFWTGTLPMLLSLGMGVQRAAGPLARRLPLASAVLLVAIGLLSIAGKLHAPAGHGQHAPSIEAHDHR